MRVLISPNYVKGTWTFGIIGVMAKILYGYWSGHLSLVRVAYLNVAVVLIIKAEKYT